MSRKGLDNRQILTLMELKGCSSATAIALSEYAVKNSIVLGSLFDLGDFLKKCHASKIIRCGFDVDVRTLEEAKDRAERIIENSVRHDIGILTCADSLYPDMLRSLVDENGKNTVPAVLYYRGDLSAADRPGVAIIGTRKPTPEGINAAWASKKPLYVVRYCSQDLMRNEQIRGNVLLAGKCAEYISLENVTSVIESLGVYISHEVIIN